MAPPNPATPTSPYPQRDTDIWLEDGSVVLVASHAVAFRIYRSLLAHHATIFKDMFSLGHSDIDEETIDNVPVVHLSDPPEALRVFLLLLMSSGFSTPRWLHPKLPEQLPFSTFDGLLRIAHKYEATHILPLLSNLLESIALSARKGPWGENCVCRPTTEAESLPVAVLVSSDDAIEVLDLARCIGADNAIAAAALWQCCLRGAVFLRDGVTREGGVVRRLSEDDYVRCVDALPRLLLSRRDVVLRTMHPANEALYVHCAGYQCNKYINSLASKYTLNTPPIQLTNPTPEAEDDGVWYGAWTHSREAMCTQCYRYSYQLLKDAFDMYWRQDLPRLFQL